MMPGAVAAVSEFRAPHLDYAALSPELVLTGVLVVVLLVDLFVEEDRKQVVGQVAGVGC